MRELPYGNDRLTSKSNAADTRKKQKGGIAQLARASALQAEGRRFDSDYLHKIKTSIRASFFVEISFDPQSLRDSPQGHTDVVKDAIGHLRSPGCARNNKKNTAFSGNGLVREKADFTDEMFKNADSSGKRLIFRTNLRFCLLIC